MATYVCSDLHGLKDRYDEMIKNIHEEDRLYILGDVIDRGPYGIEILWDIMQRDNVTLLLGNHELMMKDYYEQVLTPNEHREEIMGRWMRNHCQPTMDGFHKLMQKEQEEVLQYIASLPVAVCDITIQDRHFYLVHAYPHMNITSGVLYQEEAKNLGVLNDMVWNRIMTPTAFFEDRTLIIGHTPTMYLQEDKPYSVWTTGLCREETRLINIDCGCACNNAHTRLALLCLDDVTVTYF